MQIKKTVLKSIRPQLRRHLLKMCCTLLAIFVTALLLWGWIIPFYSVHNRPELTNSVDIRIERGWGVNQIASALHEKQLIGNKKHFIWTVRLMRKGTSLKAGRYRFDRRLSNRSLLDKLTRGDVVLKKVTIPEGLRATAIAGKLELALGVDSTEVMAYVNNRQFAHTLGIEAEQLEGYLYPDTYSFEENTSVEKILARMVHEFHENVDHALRQRIDTMGFTLHQLITLASIIEGEVIVDQERPLVASVYHNRLKKRIPLQADPTIQYILPNGPRRLYDKDLLIDSPYNTYRHFGLPPGPVGNPGKASIEAACFPEQTDYLYFVAKGDGSHVFSKTLKDHNRAKARFNQLRRALRRRNR